MRPCKSCAGWATLQEGCRCRQSWTIWSFGMLWRMSSCSRTNRTNIFGHLRARVLTPLDQRTPGSLWAHLDLNRTSAYGSLGRPFGARCSSGWPFSTGTGRWIGWPIGDFNTQTSAPSATKRKRQSNTFSRLVFSQDRFG